MAKDTNLLTQNDRRFLKRGLHYFGIPMVKIEFNNSKAAWPDIWVSVNGSIPKITVTQEWLRQTPTNRKVRLTHEMIHIKGIDHNDKAGYSTYPDKDTFSKKVYLDIMSSDRKFDRRRFGL